MPSRKQRRRREKLQRHEYEYVIETEEGEEITVERPGDREKKASADKDPKAPRDRRGRPVPKPSLQRTLKRGAIFGPILVIFAFILGGNELTTAQKITQAILLLAIFLPFSHLVDLMVYRMVQKRQAKQGGARR